MMLLLYHILERDVHLTFQNRIQKTTLFRVIS
jgi:hypothetical protein